MQLTPRYDTEPVITLDGPPSAILAPVVRQRRRLAETLSRFGADQWNHASRCAGWSTRDVIVHLDSTNSFWAFSIASAVRGEPTQFLATFDPVTSPAQLAAASDLSAGEVLQRFQASNDAFIATMERLADDDWSRPAEAPPGHISISALAHHALWDSWVHERDILLPLGMEHAVEADEVAASLRYAAALGPALACTRGCSATGVMAIAATSPTISATVGINTAVAVRSGSAIDADLTLAGDAIDLLEALSMRQPLQQDIAAQHAWMLGGLAETFDATR
jgi:uncharacterized protein (TIGR03083 family)